MNGKYSQPFNLKGGSSSVLKCNVINDQKNAIMIKGYEICKHRH
jgi:hypothetical protein